MVWCYGLSPKYAPQVHVLNACSLASGSVLWDYKSVRRWGWGHKGQLLQSPAPGSSSALSASWTVVMWTSSTTQSCPHGGRSRQGPETVGRSPPFLPCTVSARYVGHTDDEVMDAVSLLWKCGKTFTFQTNIPHKASFLNVRCKEGNFQKYFIYVLIKTIFRNTFCKQGQLK